MNQLTVVVPAKATGYIVDKYRKQVSDSTYSLSYSWKIVLGDVTKLPDNGFIYGLPFAKDKYFKVSQGPNGAFSHNDMFAYDFEMPLGTPILAARDGIVALIKADSNKGGPNRQYINDANFVSVYHSDGSIANYIHLKSKGILVTEGQVIKKGDLIGYSGNTGFSSGPHLHFEINQPQIDSSINKTVAFNWEAKSHSFFASLYHKALNYSKYIWGN
jgi:murein DD-endopeptidase MepM/ murein hydrolase activator NlpD